LLELSVNQGMSQSQTAETVDMRLGAVKTPAGMGLIRLGELLGGNTVSDVQGTEV
jgi:hypothetical protein